VTNKVRKSLAVMVAESLLVLLEVLAAFAEAPGLFAAGVVGVGVVPVRACAAVMW
jgi:hypothetical protein